MKNGRGAETPVQFCLMTPAKMARVKKAMSVVAEEMCVGLAAFAKVAASVRIPPGVMRLASQPETD